MRRLTKWSLIIMALLSMLAVTGNAAVVPCATATGNVLNITGGCTIGGLVFGTFQVLNVGSEVDLNFNPNLGAGTEGGTITDLHFSSTVSGFFHGADLLNGGLGASIQETVCNAVTDGRFGCASPSNVLWNVLARDSHAGFCSDNTASGSATTTVCNFGANLASGAVQAWVFKDISISNPATSHLTSFDETYLIPEPISMLLLGAGLAALGLLGRRHHS
jgi:hypothetical protein